MSEWISVGERLPTPDRPRSGSGEMMAKVLVYSRCLRRHAIAMYFDGGGFELMHSSSIPLGYITHWSALTEPPQ
jgi:hypothetical protein